MKKILKKIFLYLYPIKEYTSMFLFPDDSLYDEWNVKRPLPILNDCIQKRYRDNGYEVVYVLYTDKDIFGIIPKDEDRIIYTDILFSENSYLDENGEEFAEKQFNYLYSSPVYGFSNEEIKTKKIEINLKMAQYYLKI